MFLLRLSSFCRLIVLSSIISRLQGRSITPHSRRQLHGAYQTVQVDLGYNEYTANIQVGDPFIVNVRSTTPVFTEISNQISTDASALGSGNLPRYDIWPKTLSTGALTVSEPFAVKFEIWLYENACEPRKIDAALLNAMKLVFAKLDQLRTIASMGSSDGFAMSGVVAQPEGVAFLFQLYRTPNSCVGWEGFLEIQDADIAELTRQRETVLQQTTADDLLLFLGQSVSYLYHAMNRPSGSAADRRHAVSVAMSGKVSRELPSISSYYQTAYLTNVLKPAFANFAGTGRVIVLDYLNTGDGAKGFVQLLSKTGVWTGDVYFISYGGGQTVPGVQYLNSIEVESFFITRFAGGTLGRLVPPYPWCYWETPPDQIIYEDLAGVASIVQKIQAG